jgi:hypothetical protein
MPGRWRAPGRLAGLVIRLRNGDPDCRRGRTRPVNELSGLVLQSAGSAARGLPAYSSRSSPIASMIVLTPTVTEIRPPGRGHTSGTKAHSDCCVPQRDPCTLHNLPNLFPPATWHSSGSSFLIVDLPGRFVAQFGTRWMGAARSLRVIPARLVRGVNVPVMLTDVASRHLPRGSGNTHSGCTDRHSSDHVASKLEASS